MKFSLFSVLLSVSAVLSKPIEVMYGNETLNRPLIHLTPDYGWMNDPNGLWYDAKEKLWHAYYQYNPNGTVWGEPLYWGHAISKNLTIWENVGIAIVPFEEHAGAYTGSMVIDYNNTSGFFNDSIPKEQRCVAIYTYNTPKSETQYIAYSLDGGYTFKYYSKNPVVQDNSTQFRDPKVIWHEGTKKWVMTVSKTQKYEIAIYTSPNLKDWKHESDFGMIGYLGYQFECPNLAKFPIGKIDKSAHNIPSDLDEVWALFISVNPGSPQGGSSTQYVLGDFNGTHFKPFHPFTDNIDFGHDYYAQQIYFNTADNSVYAMGWSSNWDYCAFVPTDPWRSSQSLVRKFTLEEYQSNPENKILNINVQPVIDYDALYMGFPTIHKKDVKVTTKPYNINLDKGSNGLIELNMTWTVNTSAYDNYHIGDLQIFLKGCTNKNEYVKMGFVANAPEFYVDRGSTDVYFVESNPLFTHRMVVNEQPLKYDNSTFNTYSIRAIADRNILEVFFNDGRRAFTNTFFFTGGNYIGDLEIVSSLDGVFEINDLSVKQLDTPHNYFN